MPAGKKRHRVTFQQNTPAANAAGQPRPAWSHFVTVYAQIETPAGEESLTENTQRRATNRRQITINSTAKTRQITPKMRATWNGRTFEIESATDPAGNRKEIVIEATEVLP